MCADKAPVVWLWYLITVNRKTERGEKKSRNLDVGLYLRETDCSQ